MLFSYNKRSLNKTGHRHISVFVSRVRQKAFRSCVNMSSLRVADLFCPLVAQKLMSAPLTEMLIFNKHYWTQNERKYTQSDSTHQAASVDTHWSRLLVAGCAIKHTAKVVVEVVTQGQTAQFTGVRAWQGISSVSDSLVYYGKIGTAKGQGGREVAEKQAGGEQKELGHSREGKEAEMLLMSWGKLITQVGLNTRWAPQWTQEHRDFYHSWHQHKYTDGAKKTKTLFTNLCKKNEICTWFDLHDTNYLQFNT